MILLSLDEEIVLSLIQGTFPVDYLSKPVNIAKLPPMMRNPRYTWMCFREIVLLRIAYSLPATFEFHSMAILLPDVGLRLWTAEMAGDNRDIDLSILI